jgi:hypothetical protein
MYNEVLLPNHNHTSGKQEFLFYFQSANLLPESNYQFLS